MIAKVHLFFQMDDTEKQLKDFQCRLFVSIGFVEAIRAQQDSYYVNLVSGSGIQGGVGGSSPAHIQYFYCA